MRLTPHPGLSFERHAVPSPHTTAGPWPDKSLPSTEWPITGLPEPGNTPLTTHRSVDLIAGRMARQGVVLRCAFCITTGGSVSWDCRVVW
jgi:hypothetical protein